MVRLLRIGEWNLAANGKQLVLLIILSCGLKNSHTSVRKAIMVGAKNFYLPLQPSIAGNLQDISFQNLKE